MSAVCPTPSMTTILVTEGSTEPATPNCPRWQQRHGTPCRWTAGSPFAHTPASSLASCVCWTSVSGWALVHPARMAIAATCVRTSQAMDNQPIRRASARPSARLPSYVLRRNESFVSAAHVSNAHASREAPRNLKLESHTLVGCEGRCSHVLRRRQLGVVDRSGDGLLCGPDLLRSLWQPELVRGGVQPRWDACLSELRGYDAPPWHRDGGDDRNPSCQRARRGRTRRPLSQDVRPIERHRLVSVRRARWRRWCFRSDHSPGGQRRSRFRRRSLLWIAARARGRPSDGLVRAGT